MKAREITDSEGTVLVLDFVDEQWERLFQGRGEKATTHAGLRQTKNSRKPVTGNKGVIRARIIPIVTCLNCGGVRAQYVPDSPHGVRWAPVDGHYIKIDCVGREVSP